MAPERRQPQDNEAVESQMLDQALGRYDGHVFVSLPNAPTALETQSEGYRIARLGKGGEPSRARLQRAAYACQRGGGKIKGPARCQAQSGRSP